MLYSVVGDNKQLGTPVFCEIVIKEIYKNRENENNICTNKNI